MFRFPWTNEHELNLDWLIRTVKKLVKRVTILEQSGGGGGATPYDNPPSALGVADAGVSDQFSRGDHVHPMPDAGDLGAIPAPDSPLSGDFLVFDGDAWSAQSIQMWGGGAY